MVWLEPWLGPTITATVQGAQDGDHSRLKAETIMGKPKRSKGKPKKDADLEGIDIENLDMRQAPAVLQPKDKAR
jgi:hypothetical protein